MMTLKVNGRDHQVDAEPDTPLLYVLRDDLKLNAAKFGCGLGQCGSCTVIVDGKAVLSCVTPIVLLEGKQVTTLEGLGSIAAPGADPARVHRGAGGAMRLLHRRHDDAGAGAAAAHAQADRRANPQRTGSPSLPLRHAYAHPPRGEARGAIDGHRRIGSQQPRERTMNAPVILDRRRLLAGGGALIVSFSLTSRWRRIRARRLRLRRRSRRGAWRRRLISIPGFASMRMTRSRSSPERRNWGRASRPRSSRSRLKSWTLPLMR